MIIMRAFNWHLFLDTFWGISSIHISVKKMMIRKVLWICTIVSQYLMLIFQRGENQIYFESHFVIKLQWLLPFVLIVNFHSWNYYVLSHAYAREPLFNHCDSNFSRIPAQPYKLTFFAGLTTEQGESNSVGNRLTKCPLLLPVVEERKG